jgi:hypothetical protein
MNRINSSLSAFAVAMALFSTSTLGEPLSAGPSHGEPSTQKKAAFQVLGLMKTQSGAT